jgi:hypothetical protein
MKLRVVLPDAARATALTERLRVAVEPDRISVNGDGREVDIRVKRRADRRVVSVLNAVERWQHDQPGAGLVVMWLGERSYTLALQVPSETWQ